MKSLARKLAIPETTARLQQIERADDISADEISRPGNGTVHMRFSCQVHHMGNTMLLHGPHHGGLVAQVNFLENVFGMPGDLFQVGRVSRVRQAVQIDELLDLNLVNNVLDQVGSDKSGTAGNKQVHSVISG